jgi:ACS family tartrate transporter-like MFS transporter
LFTRTIGFSGISFWLPQIIQGFSGVSDLWVGFLSAIPYVVSAIGMVVIGNHSDQTGERRAYVAISAFVGAVGLLLSAYLHEPVTALAAFSLAGLGIWGGAGPLWALNTAFFGGTTAAAGSFALINSVGNLGGLVAPYIIGLFKDSTHSFTTGLFFMATALLFSGIITLGLRPDTSPEQLEPISH